MKKAGEEGKERRKGREVEEREGRKRRERGKEEGERGEREGERGGSRQGRGREREGRREGRKGGEEGKGEQATSEISVQQDSMSPTGCLHLVSDCHPKLCHGLHYCEFESQRCSFQYLGSLRI